MRNKPYPGILRLRIRYQNHRLSEASSHFLRLWLALLASGVHQRLQGAHTKSEASVQHLKPRPPDTELFPAGAVTDEPFFPALYTETKFTGLQTKAMAAFVLLSFCFFVPKLT